MKRRLLSFLIGLVVLLSAVTAVVYATGEDVTVLSADTGDLVVTTDTYIDLNGHSITGVTVAEGATLYIRDSQTDDYSVADGIYGQRTADSVRTFQQIFGLPATGVTDFATWYAISRIYVGVSRISEPD